MFLNYKVNHMVYGWHKYRAATCTLLVRATGALLVRATGAFPVRATGALLVRATGARLVRATGALPVRATSALLVSRGLHIRPEYTVCSIVHTLLVHCPPAFPISIIVGTIE